MATNVASAPATLITKPLLFRIRTEPGYGAFQLLRIGFTALLIAFGLDKSATVMGHWEACPASWMVNISSVSVHRAMLVVGVVEVLVVFVVRSSRATRPTS